MRQMLASVGILQFMEINFLEFPYIALSKLRARRQCGLSSTFKLRLLGALLLSA